MDIIINKAEISFRDEFQKQNPNAPIDTIFDNAISLTAIDIMKQYGSIDKILNKTYDVDPSLSDTEKSVHEDLKSKRLYRWIKESHNHNGYFYKEGLNIFQDKIDRSHECGYGGLYFTWESEISSWDSYGNCVREVFLLPDSKVELYVSKGKVDKFILGKKQFIHEILNPMEVAYIDELLVEYRSGVLQNNHFLYMLNNIPDNWQYRNEFYNDQINVIYGKRCLLLKDPSDEVKWKIIKNKLYDINYLTNCTVEMYDYVYQNNPKHIVKWDNKCYDVMYESIVSQNRMYDIKYMRDLINDHQLEFMRMSKYNIMLISSPCSIVLDMCIGDEELMPYHDMYCKSEEKYEIQDTDLEIQGRLLTQLHEIFDDDDILFMKMLFEHGGYMSGSFAANAILDKTYTYDDIDIYFNDYNSALSFGTDLTKFAYLRTGIVTYSSYSLLGTQIDKIITHVVKRPCSKMPKIQLMVLKSNINPVNFMMTYFDIDSCKVAVSGDWKFYRYDFDMAEISQHIFNVFKLFNINMEACNNSNNPSTVRYFSSLINSMKYYIKKVSARIDKYTARGVVFEPENMTTFMNLLNETENVIIVTNGADTVADTVTVTDTVIDTVIDTVTDTVTDIPLSTQHYENTSVCHSDIALSDVDIRTRCQSSDTSKNDCDTNSNCIIQ